MLEGRFFLKFVLDDDPLHLLKIIINMIDGILLFHIESTYTFHLFYSPLFNDSNISQRLNILRNKINKVYSLLNKMQNDDLVQKCMSFINP